MAELEPFYIADRPIVEKHLFVGRCSTLNTLRAGLAQGRGFALVAGPRMGSSSVLARVRADLQDAWRGKPGAAKITGVLVDVHQTSTHGRIAFMRKLWLTTADAIYDARASGRDALVRPRRPNFQGSKDPWGMYLSLIEDAWQAARNSGGWVRHVLLLDGAEPFLPGGALASLLQPLSAWLHSEQPWAPVAAVVAGGLSFFEHMQDKGAALSSLRCLPLSVLHSEEASTLVDRALAGMAAQARATLVRNSGQHPYVLQRLLVEIWRQGPPGDVQAAVHAAWPDITALYEEIWQALVPEWQPSGGGASGAQLVFGALLEAQQPLSLRALETMIRRADIRVALDKLEMLGVIEQQIVADVPHWRAQSDLWNYWYRNHISLS